MTSEGGADNSIVKNAILMGASALLSYGVSRMVSNMKSEEN